MYIRTYVRTFVYVYVTLMFICVSFSRKTLTAVVFYRTSCMVEVFWYIEVTRTTVFRCRGAIRSIGWYKPRLSMVVFWGPTQQAETQEVLQQPDGMQPCQNAAMWQHATLSFGSMLSSMAQGFHGIYTTLIGVTWEQSGYPSHTSDQNRRLGVRLSGDFMIDRLPS